MTLSHSEQKPIFRIVRWAAVGVGIAFVIFVIVMNILGAPPRGESAPTTVWDVVKLLAMVTVFVGVGLSWKWPLTGGILILAGYLSFEGLMYAEQQRFAGGLFLIFPALAVVHIVIHFIRQNRTLPA